MHVLKTGNHFFPGRKASLKFRLISIIIIQILLTLLFICASVFMVTSSVFNNYCTNAEQLSRTTVSRLEFQFDEMANISELPSIIVNGSYSILNKKLNTSGEWTLAMSNAVKTEFQPYINSNTFIDTLCVCNTQGDGVFLQPDVYNFYNCKANTASGWFSSVINSKGEAIFFSNVSADDTGILKRTRSGKIYGTPVSGLTRAIRNPLTSTNIGVITLTINEENILSEFLENRLYEHQQIILYLNDSLLTASEKEYPQQIISCTRKQAFAIVKGQPHIIHYLSNNDFCCWIYTPLYEIFHNSFALFPIIILDILLFLLIILYINATMKSITGPLNTLTVACQQFSMDSPADLDANDAPAEFKPLFSTFNEMYSRLNKLVNDIYIKDIEQKNLEIQFLRSQINPHYLYNTLECLHLMAYADKSYDVALMAELLGKNLQYGLNNQTQEVSLETEMEKVREYVHLISFGYKNLINVHYGIDPGILSSLTLRMIIQPILENSYVHGLSEQYKSLSIEILGYRDGNNVIIKIFDDGVGIPESRLVRLQEQLSSDTPSSSIGINNVNRRIRLFYGKAYGLQIDSHLMQGTLITITLPYHEQNWNETGLLQEEL